ncbi:unnamed protein product [Moneuplotes crassus]|uniref:RNA helicase n=1 Tax=Euplotes crassus TaxID=5936 RepID=A0AAD1U0X5_EUPCR|nr:unnamed protein product [Moneuplotes crassus]
MYNPNPDFNNLPSIPKKRDRKADDKGPGRKNYRRVREDIPGGRNENPQERRSRGGSGSRGFSGGRGRGQRYKPSTQYNKNLSIANKRKDIIDQIRNGGRVTIIAGNTGCGKTTQVPQYILQDDPDAFILCTQPRRLAAINIAKRVADETKTRVGELVGYHVGSQAKLNNRTRILFMTTGIFLQRLVNRDDFLQKVTHVVLDEVHERDCDIDFAMVILKHILKRSYIKLILMSATIQASSFCHYFSEGAIDNVQNEIAYSNQKLKIWSSDEKRGHSVVRKEGWGKVYHTEGEVDPWENTGEEAKDWGNSADALTDEMPVKRTNDPAVVIDVSSQSFAVKVTYLEFVLEGMDEVLKIPKTDPIYDIARNFNPAQASLDELTIRATSTLIVQLLEAKNSFKEEPGNKRTILVFMPGLHEIMQLIETIENEGSDAKDLLLIPLHSSIGEDEQEKAFRDPPAGRRKVIIATNIAESSITIPDVYYVVDLCLTKEIFYDPINKNENLQLRWASKASCRQRSGRAGRVQDGFVFRMVPHEFYKCHMSSYPTPEIQRCPLEKLILQIKLWGMFEPAEILGRAIQPPLIRDIGISIKALQETGALTIDKSGDTTGDITELGRIFVNIPADIKITRLFLLGLAFGCMSQAITMGCLHSQQRSMFKSIGRGHGAWSILNTKLKYDGGVCSDSIMMCRVYEEWCSQFHREHFGAYTGGDRVSRRPKVHKNRDELKWCRSIFVDWSILKETLILIEDIRFRFVNLGVQPDVLNKRVEYNEDGINTLRTVLAGAFYRRYIRSEYRNVYEREKYLKPQIIPKNVAGRSVLYSKVPDYIKEPHVQAVINNHIGLQAERVVIMYEKPIVTLEGTSDKLKLMNNLKRCFKIDRKVSNADKAGFGDHSRMRRQQERGDARPSASEKVYSVEKQKFRAQACLDDVPSDDEDLNSLLIKEGEDIDDKTAMKLLEETQLKHCIHLDQIRMATFDNEVFVDAEQDSVNFVYLHSDPDTMDSVGFCCQSFDDRGGKFTARSVTKMPEYSMISLLYCMLFSPMVELMANETGDYYERVMLDNDKNSTYPLKYWITPSDIEAIDDIRKTINESICSEDGLKSGIAYNVAAKLNNFIKKERVKIDQFHDLILLRSDEQDFAYLVDRIRNFFVENPDRPQDLQINRVGESSHCSHNPSEENRAYTASVEATPSNRPRGDDPDSSEATLIDPDDAEKTWEPSVAEAQAQSLKDMSKKLEAFEESDSDEAQEQAKSDSQDGSQDGSEDGEGSSEADAEGTNECGSKMGYDSSSSDDIKMASPGDATKDPDKDSEDRGGSSTKKTGLKNVKKVSYFLNKLSCQTLCAKKVFAEGEPERIKREYDQRLWFRKKVVREMQARCELFKLRSCAIVCASCESRICDLKSLVMRKEAQGLCEIGGTLCGLTELNELSQEQRNDPYVISSSKNIRKSEDFSYLMCHYNHICGIRVKFKYYFTKTSPVLFKFPMGSTREWSPLLWKNNFAEAFAQDEIAQKEIDWSNVLPEDRTCFICPKKATHEPDEVDKDLGRVFNTVDDYIYHIEADRDHLIRVEKFLLRTVEEDSY